ncbi:MAG: asparagine synthase (glutamine-hydrolyzing) [Phycisphaerales bacterium]
MCRIARFISNAPVNTEHVQLMQGQLVHRGPDDHGILKTSIGVIAHQRLSILDTGHRGHQPMTTKDGRFSIVYNGELYNDHELRKELEALGVVFESACDTETVLYAVAHWGMNARSKLRGMYSFACVDHRLKSCLLARDPMGIKPLYISRVNSTGLAFASEIKSILAHPEIPAVPDQVTMDAYLSTIRPEFGTRTLFAGIQSISPGQWMLLGNENFETIEAASAWDSDSTTDFTTDFTTRSVIEDSVTRHLRTDVPMCSLLSGGLDSSIISKIAMDELGELHTFCAGAPSDKQDDDLVVASLVARHLGTKHTEIPITSQTFFNRWIRMVQDTGLPLSTPNEVAIYEVSNTLASQGFKVALSGEGADELFGGYAIPMLQAQEFSNCSPVSDELAGRFHLESNAWITNQTKPMLMSSDWFSEIEHDESLQRWYQDSYTELRSQCESSLQAHLRFHRRVNLPNLLRRLDTSTMLVSVEGRTPFADQRVCRYAESLPMDQKFRGASPEDTKYTLRQAFAGTLPEQVLQRPKASFPLPFEEWITQVAGVLNVSTFAATYFKPEAIQQLVAQPAGNWNLLWPMLNLTLWGERWWGTDDQVAEYFDKARLTVSVTDV